MLLNAIDGVAPPDPAPADPLAPPAFGAPPPPNACNACAVAAIFPATPSPKVAKFVVTNPAAAATDAPAVGIASAAPAAVAATFDAFVATIDLPIPSALSAIIAAFCNSLFFPAILVKNPTPASSKAF